MARPKTDTPVSNIKTYMQRFTSFKNGFCPYCGAQGAELIARESRKGKVLGYRGHCVKCNAENNFTKPDCKIQMGN